MSDSTQMTPGQRHALVTTERVNSCVSLVGIAFVISTFLFSKSFNKPINRLIFFASFGNMGSNIAALIADAGPLAGNNAPLCQFQAFLVQMFLGVDCYWAFCMAINVYLVFFRGYTVERLRSLDLRYLIACYGLSFVPAFVFIFISNRSQGHIYGNAIIWCWITTERDWMRFVFLYGIVWLAIVFAFVVYGMAGKVIWSKRRHLDGFLNPFNEHPFTNTVTTEIEITTDERPIINKETSSSSPEVAAFGSPEGATFGGPEGLALETSRFSSEGVDPYSIDIHATPHSRSLPAALRMRTLTRDAAASETNAEAWLYARVAFLFFFALLITWIPSSVNRLYAVARPNEFNFALNYTSSFVFPLQGFWNVLVYVITSQTACKRLWRDMFGGGRGYDGRERRRESSATTLTGGDDKHIFFTTGKQRLGSIASSNSHSP